MSEFESDPLAQAIAAEAIKIAKEQYRAEAKAEAESPLWNELEQLFTEPTKNRERIAELKLELEKRGAFHDQ